MALRLAHFAAGEPLPFVLYTATGKSPGKFLPTCRPGQALPLEARDTGWGYFLVRDAGLVLQHLLEKYRELTSAQADPFLLADTLLVLAVHLFPHLSEGTPGALPWAKDLLAVLGRKLEAAANPLAALAPLRRHDSGLFSHCLNVCLLALALAPKFGVAGEDREQLALAALLHDIGLLAWAEQTYHQTAPLEEGDFEHLKVHPRRGAELLAALGAVAGAGLSAVGQHHENLDGSGYPCGLKGEEIHPWARLLRILDSYEALTSLRPWRPPLPHSRVLHLMATSWRTLGHYDPHFLDLFLSSCSGARQDPGSRKPGSPALKGGTGVWRGGLEP